MEVVAFKSRIWEQLREITENMVAAFRPVEEEFGLTVLQFRILHAVCCAGCLTVGGLAKQLNIADANASSMCKRLEKMGYLERTRDAHDERVVQIVPSDRGLHTLETVRMRMEEQYARVLENVPEEEIRGIYDSMEKLKTLLHKMAEQPKESER